MGNSILDLNPAAFFQKLKGTFVSPHLYRLLFSVGVIGVVFAINRIVIRTINHQIDDTNRRHVYRKIVNYAAFTVGIVGLLFTWIHNLAFLTAAIGFIAAGLAVAMSDVIMSLFGWLKILWADPFGVGDRIEISNIEGDIIDISPLHTVVLELGNWVAATQSTGRIIYIPNHLIFQQPVSNSTLGFPYLWDEFSILVTFESDFDVAEELLKDPVEEEIGINYRRARQDIQELSNRYAIHYENLNPRVYMSVQDSGVQLTLRYLTRSRGRRETKSRLSKKIMQLLAEHPEVELAYPTYRIFRRDREEAPDSPTETPEDTDPTTS
jgi:small-conductance mechanosensitive channel